MEEHIEQVPIESDKLQQFFTDIINSVIYNTPVSYITKYPTINHYRTILNIEQIIKKLLYRIIEVSATNKQQLQPLIADINVPENVRLPIYKTVKNKMQQIWKEMIRKQIALGSACLVGYDWKIINVIGCNSNTKKNRTLLRLNLIIRSLQNHYKTISLEMNSQQLVAFVNTLKNIKKDIKNESI